MGAARVADRDAAGGGGGGPPPPRLGRLDKAQSGHVGQRLQHPATAGGRDQDLDLGEVGMLAGLAGDRGDFGARRPRRLPPPPTRRAAPRAPPPPAGSKARAKPRGAQGWFAREPVEAPPPPVPAGD